MELSGYHLDCSKKLCCLSLRSWKLQQRSFSECLGCADCFVEREMIVGHPDADCIVRNLEVFRLVMVSHRQWMQDKRKSGKGGRSWSQNNLFNKNR